MNLLKSCYICVLIISLAGCKVSCSSGNIEPDKTKTVTSGNNNTELSGAIIKNDIDIEASGVKISQVYLMNEDREFLKENEAAMGEKIYLVIKADTGWVKINDRSFLGASERIMTAAGHVAVDAVDIFKDYDTEGLPAEDAHLINLSAVITQADPGVKDFVVRFKVWDKKGKAEVKGSYKFKLK